MHSHSAWLQKLDPETTDALVHRLRDKTKHDGGFPILEDIVMLGRADAAEQVLKEGEPADNPNFQNYTPLMFAAARDETKIIDLLLAAGASPNHFSSYDGFSPLMMAARYGKTDAAKRLLDAHRVTCERGSAAYLEHVPTCQSWRLLDHRISSPPRRPVEMGSAPVGPRRGV
jgi:hypothetical protein